MMKMNTKTLVAVGLVASMGLLAGCMSFGNSRLAKETPAKLKKELVKGKTTEAQVRKLLGDPQNTSFRGNGDAIWTYQFVKEKADAEDFIPFWGSVHQSGSHNMKSLTLLFTQKGVLKNYTFSNSKGRYHAGIGA